MGFQILCFIVGSVFLVRPQWTEPLSRRAHAARLKALKAGEPEAYFEEQRSLEVYRPARTSGLMWRRLLGGLMVLTAAALFLRDRLPLI